MKKTLALLVFAAATFVAADRAYAHHSFAATYLEDQSVTIEGDLIQFLFRNPHSYIHLDVKEPDGSLTRWAVEWSGGGQLFRAGVFRETLKPGDHLILTGNPGRIASDHRLRLRSVSRPKDGWKWSGTVE